MKVYKKQSIVEPHRKKVKILVTKKAELIRLEAGERFIKLIFPFNPDDVTRIKSIEEYQYKQDGRYWLIPFRLSTIKNLVLWNFKLSDELQKYLTQMTAQTKNLKTFDIPGLRHSLFPYQSIGVSFIEMKKGNALIADEMGLGKTVQALAWLQLHPEKRPVIIVVPASLKLNWKKESYSWMKSPKVQILSGSNTNIEICGEILIINYDILWAWRVRLKAIKAKVLIADECHYFKNNQAKRTKAIMQIGKDIPHILALSGTPIQNRPMEIYNAVKLIDSSIFPNYYSFGHRFCGAKHNGFGWDFNGASNMSELYGILMGTIMIRRLKKEVLQDLPDKRYSFIPLELDNEKEYQEASHHFLNYIKRTKGEEAEERASSAETLGKIEVLKQLACRGKIKQAIEWIQDFLNGGGKLVVFAIHKETIDTICNAFPDITVKIDGSVSEKERDIAVTEFQTNTAIRLFVGNIKAAGVGITLTASSNVVFLELPWTPGELAQAIDRVHRIGQKFQVFVRFLLASGTIEEEIGKLIDEKRIILDRILDGGEMDNSSLLTDLMNKYKLAA